MLIYAFLFFIKSTETLPRCITILNGESIYLYLWFGDILDGDHIRETLRKKLFKLLFRHTVSGTWKMSFWADDSISNYIFFRIDCGIWKQVFIRQLSIRAKILSFTSTRSPVPCLYSTLISTGWGKKKISKESVRIFQRRKPNATKNHFRNRNPDLISQNW